MHPDHHGADPTFRRCAMTKGVWLSTNKSRVRIAASVSDTSKRTSSNDLKIGCSGHGMLEITGGVRVEFRGGVVRRSEFQPKYQTALFCAKCVIKPSGRFTHETLQEST